MTTNAIQYWSNGGYIHGLREAKPCSQFLEDGSIRTTQHVPTDYWALWEFHLEASKDSRRSLSSRQLHRLQAASVRQHHVPPCQGSTLRIKVALIAFMSELFRQKMEISSKSLFPWNWKRFCEATLRDIERHEGCYARARTRV